MIPRWLSIWGIFCTMVVLIAGVLVMIAGLWHFLLDIFTGGR